MTTATLSSDWIMLPTTWPVSSDAREIAMVRNLATIPSVMSVATETAVAVAAPAIVISSMPGVT